MVNPDEILRRRARIARRLTERGMEMARDVQAKMSAAKTSDLCKLADEFERASRLVLENIALEAELEQRLSRREARAALRFARAEAAIPDPETSTRH